MPEHTPAFIIRSWFEDIYNRARADLIGVYVSPMAHIHGLDETGAHCIGPDGFKSFYDKLKATIPDIQFTVHEVIAEGPTAACRWTAVETHSGDHLGPRATDSVINVSGMSFVHLESGQIVEAWNDWDRLGFALAIGAVAPVQRIATT